MLMSSDSKADKDEKSGTKRSGPAAPAPPPPLKPIDLPAPPKDAKPAGGPDDVADASVSQKLAAKVVDDGDLIEKEWVTKVKQIVEQYRGDPYRQSEELTLLRVNYMQRHFGKTIKLSK